jgi:RNA polymerase sigma factor (sigma-70 family)
VTLASTEAPGEDGDHEHAARRAPAVAETRRADLLTPVTVEIPQLTRQPAWETTLETVGQPARETARQPARETTRETAPQTGWETARQPSRETGRETAGQAALDTPREMAPRPAEEAGRAGAEGSFEAFYRETYPRLVGRAVLRGLSRDDAADAAQDALVGVYKQWTKLHPLLPDARIRYAARALTNSVTDVRRSRGRDSDLPKELCPFVRNAEDDSGSTDALDLVRRLPERQRTVILLLDEGWTPNEIAKRLRIGATSVRTHLQIARKTLREKLRKEDDRG